MEAIMFPRRPFLDRLALLRPWSLAVAAALVVSCAPQTPPEAARPAPPPAPAERAYIVFFECGTATIGPRGRQIIAEAARNAGGEGGSGRVELQAYADRSGRADRNQRLSELRADAVAAELVRQGVRRDRITIRSHGENRAFVPTKDGEREGQNRSVWIVLR
jgi:OmpA-OmpF porin, OOP family